MNNNEIEEYLEELFPNPKCELNYNKDYELVIATVLSAQTTDKRVNEVTKVLFNKYDTIEKLSEADTEDIKEIIKSLGSYNKKSIYVKEIAKQLLEKHNGVVPNDRNAIETLPGAGRKTANLVLGMLFNYPAIAVDTHVSRISKRLGYAKEEDDHPSSPSKSKWDIGWDWWWSKSRILQTGKIWCICKNGTYTYIAWD